jgi:hypothetical protein
MVQQAKTRRPRLATPQTLPARITSLLAIRSPVATEHRLGARTVPDSARLSGSSGLWRNPPVTGVVRRPEMSLHGGSDPKRDPACPNSRTRKGPMVLGRGADGQLMQPPPLKLPVTGTSPLTPQFVLSTLTPCRFAKVQSPDEGRQVTR